MGGLTVLLDDALATPGPQRRPTVPAVLQAIAFFSFQYFVSGVLAGNYLWDPLELSGVLLGMAALCQLRFDRSLAGLAVGVATAVGGPVIELGLTTFTDLYRYVSPDFASVSSWIPWVYLCGGPAVCNLARLQWSALVARGDSDSDPAEDPREEDVGKRR